MACDSNRQKRSHEEISEPSKRPCLNTDDLSMQNLALNLDDTISVSPVLDSVIIPENSSNSMTATCDDTSFLHESKCNHNSATDFLNNFFNDFDLNTTDFNDMLNSSSNLGEETSQELSRPTLNLGDKPCQELSSNLYNEICNKPCQELTSNLYDEICNKPSQESSSNLSRIHEQKTNINKDDLSDSISYTKGKKSSNSMVFQKELADFMFLSLKLHNKQYYVHIREFKQGMTNKEQSPIKNAVVLDIASWYEFQYKIFAFNLHYKSSSFVANNTILVLNYNNSVMHSTNLRNYSFAELNDYQLEKLKEVTYDLNKKLIYHMYTIQLPFLIKRKCKLGKMTIKNETALMDNLIMVIEENLLTILNRIYECSGCIFNQVSQSLHSCSMFNNREKLQQIGDMVMCLIDLDLVVSLFSNVVDCISESFLSKMNVNTIQNVLFKRNKT